MDRHRPKRHDFSPREDSVRSHRPQSAGHRHDSMTFNQYNVTVHNNIVQQKPHPGVYIENRHLKREARSLREEKEEKEKQLEEREDEIYEKEKENEDLKRRIDHARNIEGLDRARFLRQNAQIDGLSKVNMTLKTENKTVKSEFRTVQKENEYFKEELTAKEKQLQQEKREKELSTMTVERLSKIIINYEAEAVNFNKRVDFEITNRDNEIEEKKSKIRYLKKDIDQLNGLLESIQSRTDDEWRLEVERLQVKLTEEIKNGRHASEEVKALKEEIERLKAEKIVPEVKIVEEGRVPVAKICSDLKIENENLKNQNIIYLSLLIIFGSIVSAWLLLKLV